MRLQLWISRDNGGGSSSNKLRTPGLNRSRLEEHERLWQQLSCLNAENWYTESNKTLTWASPPYYFVSVVTDKGYSTHTTLSRCVWTACLCWLEEWQPMDSYEGSRVMAKLNYVHAICQWWPYHCFCLLTPSSVIMWLCFDMTVAMCMVCTCIFLPIHALSGYHELWTMYKAHRSETNFEKGASNRNSPPGMQEHFRLAFWISILMCVYWKCRCICTRTVFAFCFVLQALQGLAINKIPNIEWFCSTVYTSTPPRLPPPIFRGSGSETSLVPRLRPRSWAWERG